MKINEEIIFDFLVKELNIDRKKAVSLIREMSIKQIKDNYEETSDKTELIEELVNMMLKDITFEIVNYLLDSNEFENIINLKEEYLHTIKTSKN